MDDLENNKDILGKSSILELNPLVQKHRDPRVEKCIQPSRIGRIPSR